MSSLIRDLSLIASSFAALTHRWRHLPHLFLEEPWADLAMAASITERSFSYYPRHLSVHLASASSSPLLTDSRACAHCLPMTCNSHTHTFTHRLTPMMIPNSRIDTIIPQGSPTTYLCFVKYGNDSININNDVTRKLVYSPSIQNNFTLSLSPAKKKEKTISTEESLLDINLYIFIYTAHTETGTVGQRMTGAVIRETDSLLGSHVGGKDWRRCSECGEDLLAPPHCSPSDRFLLPSKPPKMHICLGGRHTLKFAWVRVRGHVKQQSRNVEQTVMHVRLPWIRHSGTPLLFFLSNLTFLLFFYYCYFFFFGVFLVLSTKVILNVVLSLSRFILSSNLVFICPLYSIFLSIMFVLALVMREAGTQRLKFSCKRSCLVKLCCILK